MKWVDLHRSFAHVAQLHVHRLHEEERLLAQFKDSAWKYHASLLEAKTVSAWLAEVQRNSKAAQHRPHTAAVIHHETPEGESFQRYREFVMWLHERPHLLGRLALSLSDSHKLPQAQNASQASHELVLSRAHELRLAEKDSVATLLCYSLFGGILSREYYLLLGALRAVFQQEARLFFDGQARSGTAVDFFLSKRRQDTSFGLRLLHKMLLKQGGQAVALALRAPMQSLQLLNTNLDLMEGPAGQTSRKQLQLKGGEQKQSDAGDRADRNWQCTRCTLLNAPSNSTCEMCGAPHTAEDQWQCQKCTLVNPEDKAKCQMCGGDRSFDPEGKQPAGNEAAQDSVAGQELTDTQVHRFLLEDSRATARRSLVCDACEGFLVMFRTLLTSMHEKTKLAIGEIVMMAMSLSSDGGLTASSVAEQRLVIGTLLIDLLFLPALRDPSTHGVLSGVARPHKHNLDTVLALLEWVLRSAVSVSEELPEAQQVKCVQALVPRTNFDQHGILGLHVHVLHEWVFSKLPVIRACFRDLVVECAALSAPVQAQGSLKTALSTVSAGYVCLGLGEMIQLHRCVVGTGAQGLPLDHGTIPRELRPFVDLPSSLSRTQSQPTEQKGGTAAKNSKVPQSRMAGELVSVTGEWLKRRAEEASAAVKGAAGRVGDVIDQGKSMFPNNSTPRRGAAGAVGGADEGSEDETLEAVFMLELGFAGLSPRGAGRIGPAPLLSLAKLLESAATNLENASLARQSGAGVLAPQAHKGIALTLARIFCRVPVDLLQEDRYGTLPSSQVSVETWATELARVLEEELQRTGEDQDQWHDHNLSLALLQRARAELEKLPVVTPPLNRGVKGGDSSCSDPVSPTLGISPHRLDVNRATPTSPLRSRTPGFEPISPQLELSPHRLGATGPPTPTSPLSHVRPRTPTSLFAKQHTPTSPRPSRPPPQKESAFPPPAEPNPAAGLVGGISPDIQRRRSVPNILAGHFHTGGATFSGKPSRTETPGLTGSGTNSPGTSPILRARRCSLSNNIVSPELAISPRRLVSGVDTPNCGVTSSSWQACAKLSSLDNSNNSSAWSSGSTTPVLSNRKVEPAGQPRGSMLRNDPNAALAKLILSPAPSSRHRRIPTPTTPVGGGQSPSLLQRTLQNATRSGTPECFSTPERFSTPPPLPPAPQQNAPPSDEDESIPDMSDVEDQSVEEQSPPDTPLPSTTQEQTQGLLCRREQSSKSSGHGSNGSVGSELVSTVGYSRPAESNHTAWRSDGDVSWAVRNMCEQLLTAIQREHEECWKLRLQDLLLANAAAKRQIACVSSERAFLCDVSLKERVHAFIVGGGINFRAELPKSVSAPAKGKAPAVLEATSVRDFIDQFRRVGPALQQHQAVAASVLGRLSRRVREALGGTPYISASEISQAARLVERHVYTKVYRWTYLDDKGQEQQQTALRDAIGRSRWVVPADLGLDVCPPYPLLSQHAVNSPKAASRAAAAAARLQDRDRGNADWASPPPRDLLRSSMWEPGVLAMVDAGRWRSPRDKMDCLIRSVKATTIALKAHWSAEKPVDGDAALSGLVYSILCTPPCRLDSTLRFIKTFLPEEDLRSGEAAWCFTQFESACDFIQNSLAKGTSNSRRSSDAPKKEEESQEESPAVQMSAVDEDEPT